MDLNLENVGLGAISEKFDDELIKIIENVLDPNTEAKTLREINIKLQIKPNPENREMCEMKAIVSSKLAPTKTLVSILQVGIDEVTGETNAVETVQQQGVLFDPPSKSTGKIAQING